MKKNEEETSDYTHAVEICDKHHENFYRMKQNDEATNFDNFCAPDILTMRQQSMQRESLEK